MVSPIFYPQSNSISSNWRIIQLDSEPILLSSHFLHRPWHRKFGYPGEARAPHARFQLHLRLGPGEGGEEDGRFQKNMAVEATKDAN